MYLSKFFFILFILSTSLIQGQDTHENNVISTDIDNYWEAYDKIRSTQDSTLQMQYIHEYYLDKASPGLKAIIWARRYKAEEFVVNINNYPKFWESIRANTHQSKELSGELKKGVQKLKYIYPDLKPASIYFTVGAFRTGGTTVENLVLIGSEISMTNAQTETSEFGETLSHLPSFFKKNPIDNIVFLNVHEYIHTQQVQAIGSNLLSQCLREGISEYITEIALDMESTTPAIKYGKANDAKVRKVFTRSMFSKNYGFWLWSNVENEFKMRDLGYYIGYAIADKYYKKSDNKKEAIKTLIELDYQNSEAVEKFINEVEYFSDAVVQYKPETLIDQQLAAYNAGNIEAFLTTFADDVEVYNFPNELLYTGKEKMREIYQSFFEREPNLHCNITTRIIKDDTIIDHEEITGLKDGSTFKAVAIYKVINNKIAKVYFVE